MGLDIIVFVNVVSILYASTLTHTQTHNYEYVPCYIQGLQIDVEDKKAQLRVLREEIGQKDAEISRLLGDLRVANSQAHTVRYKVCWTM